jgi:hypothetical protein
LRTPLPTLRTTGLAIVNFHDDHQPCADQGSFKIGPIAKVPSRTTRRLSTRELRSACAGCRIACTSRGRSFLSGAAVNPHRPTINAAVRLLRVQGDPPPPCGRLFKWVPAGQHVRHLSSQVRNRPVPLTPCQPAILRSRSTVVSMLLSMGANNVFSDGQIPAAGHGISIS